MAPSDDRSSTTTANRATSGRLRRGGWAAIVVLAALLAAAIGYAIHVWNQLSGVAVSGQGWFAMALVFYSSRKNYDQ